MTLVIAQRIGRQITLSSDSRISFNNWNFIDYGIKIFPVPLKINSPIASETGSYDTAYEHQIGLAIIGSTTNAYTVKESIYEILQHLQYIPGKTNVSMDNIANLMLKVYSKVAKDMSAINRELGLCELILTGFCPLTMSIRTFLFSTAITASSIQPGFEEILTTDGMLFFGSGKKIGEKTFSEDSSLIPLQILRKIIHNNLEKTVGGGMQFGDFDNNLNFRICGVRDYTLHSDGSFKEYINTLRGLSIYKDEFERDADGFHISYTFVTPFQNEINEMFKDI